MLKSACLTLALAAGVFATAPASAMPVRADLAAQVGSGVDKVALYCNPVGVCVSAPRMGYVYRAPVYVAPRNNTVVKKTVTVKPNGNKVVKKKVIN